MRKTYLGCLRLNDKRWKEARRKALNDPEYQEIKKQVEELIFKKYETLDRLTKKYYNELEES